jgi:hypothetical protein
VAGVDPDLDARRAMSLRLRLAITAGATLAGAVLFVLELDSPALSVARQLLAAAEV